MELAARCGRPDRRPYRGGVRRRSPTRSPPRPTLRLVGVAGYEGEVPVGRPGPGAGLAAPAGRAGRRLRRARAVRRRRVDRRQRGRLRLVRRGGGGVRRDRRRSRRPCCKLLRSGAYVTHDDDHYRRITPFNRVPQEGALEPAFRLWTQVVSRPAPGQAFVNAGKRDAAYDLGLPEVAAIRSARDGSVRRPAPGVRVTKLSDQHAWLALPPEEELEVGDWVALGPVPPVHVVRQVASSFPRCGRTARSSPTSAPSSDGGRRDVGRAGGWNWSYAGPGWWTAAAASRTPPTSAWPAGGSRRSAARAPARGASPGGGCSTPTASRSRPASSTCTRTATSPCWRTPRTRRRPPRA